MSKTQRLLVPIILIFVSSTLAAQQLSFNKINKGNSYQFNYQWLDHKQQPQEISFELSNSALFNKFRNFRVYKPQFAAEYINKKVIKHFNKEPIEQVQITFDRQEKGISIQSNNLAKAKEARKKVESLTTEITNTYLKQNWYHSFTTHQNIRAIKPDHVTISALSVTDLKPMRPLILEKVSIKNIREATNFVLGFIQNIPYSTLESRINSSGAGFNPPSKLLWENQGDCDSKATLATAILRTLMPRVKMVIVFIENHALIGIETLAEGDETTITLDGITYLLGEPTGPSLLPLGKLDQASELAILQGQYIAEAIN